MSAIYNLEPQPTALAIIHTTQGELSVELWAKQAPLTCRNFLQLALDGYYDDTIFHRLVPGFILQGGDPSGTGNGGESIYDGGEFNGELGPWPEDQRTGLNAGSHSIGFKDEFHSRLKFTRRGLLAMANEGKPNTNGSQFFFTLDRTDNLNGKNTLFGRIVGDTMYNLIKMGEAEVVEGTERPMYPAKITRIEIMVNPFDDMVKRSKKAAAPAVQHKTVLVDRKKKKRKGGKKLLSFGDDEGEEEEILPLPKKKKFDTRIVMEDIEEEGEKEEKEEKEEEKEEKEEKEKVKAEKSEMKKEKAIEKSTKELETKSEPEQVTKPTKSQIKFTAAPSSSRMDIDSSGSPEPKQKTALERTRDEIAALKATIKSEHESAVQEHKKKKKSALESMIPEKSVKGRRRRPGGQGISEREEHQAMSFLKNFQEKLSSAPVDEKVVDAPAVPEGDEAEGAAAVDAEEEADTCDLHYIPNCQSCKVWDRQEDAEESDDEGWMGHALSFTADKLGKDLSYRKKAEEELVVIDPLAKARNLKVEKRAERDRRGGGERKGRAWDERKNAQMARNAGMTGRGAK